MKVASSRVGWGVVPFAAALFLSSAAAQAGTETPGARLILDRAVAAMGGPDAVYETLTLVVSATSTRSTPSGSVRSGTTTYLGFPLSVRQEIVLDGKTIAMASTPEGAFLESGTGIVELPEAARHNLEASAMRNPVALLKGRRGRAFEAKEAGKAQVGDTSADVLEIRVGPNVTMVAFAPDGRMLQQRYQVLGEDGRQGWMEVRFDDFREAAGGLVYPHRVRANFDGSPAFESVISGLRRNETLSPRLFASGMGAAGFGVPSSGSRR